MIEPAGLALRPHAPGFVERGRKPMENWRIDLVDQWNDGAIVGTFATPAEAYEAIRKLGQETRDGQWRYTLAPVLGPVYAR